MLKLKYCFVLDSLQWHIALLQDATKMKSLTQGPNHGAAGTWK